MFIVYENMWLSELPLCHQSCMLLSFLFVFYMNIVEVMELKNYSTPLDNWVQKKQAFLKESVNLKIRLCLLQQTLPSRQKNAFLAEIPRLDVGIHVLQNQQLVSNKLIVAGKIFMYVVLTKAFPDQVRVLITMLYNYTKSRYALLSLSTVWNYCVIEAYWVKAVAFFVM